jgi:hypothetical protein
MGLKIVCLVEYQIVTKVSLTAMPFRGEGGHKQKKVNTLGGRRQEQKKKNALGGRRQMDLCSYRC